MTARSNQSILKEINPEYSLKYSLECSVISNIHWTDAETEAPILWPPDSNSQLIGKDPNTGIDRRQKKKHEAEDEMLR